MQILLVGPAQDNYIAIPDGSGVFVIGALAPLYVDTSGTVYLAQDLITQVGQLMAGSIGRSFGKALCRYSCSVKQHERVIVQSWITGFILC